MIDQSHLLARVPSPIRTILGTKSCCCLLSGKDVFTALQDEELIVMGCNPRIRHVIPGIMRAAEELDALVAFELSRSEGGLDGGYTGQRPADFVSTILGYAEECHFRKPFIIHADHITIQDTTAEELAAAEKLIAAQLAAGYTSFALDASFNELDDNIRIITRLAKPIVAAGYALEVELGDIKSVAESATLTTVEESERFLTGLAAAGITPQLLAIYNGSRSGNYLDGEMVRIDLERTLEIYNKARSFGVSGLVQHGITGTPPRIVGKLAEYGIRKGNVGTLWQNVAHAGLPLDLMDAMRKWARENRQDIKYASRVFKGDIDAIPAENAGQIHDMAYREAKEFFTAFRARGSASRLAKLLKEVPCG